MTDHDELLARADRVVAHSFGETPAVAVIAELAAALRAALAARSDPLFEGTVGDWLVLDGEERYVGIEGYNLGSHENPNSWPEWVVVYPAAAGSATPTEEDT
jgi:hypothetical protein